MAEETTALDELKNVVAGNPPDEKSDICMRAGARCGSAIVAFILGYAFGFLTGVGWNLPWSELMLCKNGT